MDGYHFNGWLRDMHEKSQKSFEICEFSLLVDGRSNVYQIVISRIGGKSDKSGSWIFQ